MEARLNVLKGLISDGMIAVFYSYRYLVKEKENIELGLVYLNEANSFFTAAKILYYENEARFLEKKLVDIFYEFGRYNDEILRKLRRNEKSDTGATKAFFELSNELQWLSIWLGRDI